MDKTYRNLLTGLLRGLRVLVHLGYGAALAVAYPRLSQTRQNRIMKNWSRHLLDILNIGIQIEGEQPPMGEPGCMIVANHISWLDIFVLNALQPARFIAKAEVRNWPLIGWLCQRSGTIFIERAMRQSAATINRHVALSLQQGACIGLFPEGTTTDGKLVSHFHSALVQPAIDAGSKLSPVALRYLNDAKEMELAAAFTGDTSLAQSIWQILCCPHMNALVVYTPALQAGNENRRLLARTAQNAISQALHGLDRQSLAPIPHSPAVPQLELSSRSSYALLIDPLTNSSHK